MFTKIRLVNQVSIDLEEDFTKIKVELDCKDVRAWKFLWLEVIVENGSLIEAPIKVNHVSQIPYMDNVALHFDLEAIAPKLNLEDLISKDSRMKECR